MSHLCFRGHGLGTERILTAPPSGVKSVPLLPGACAFRESRGKQLPVPPVSSLSLLRALLMQEGRCGVSVDNPI